MSSKAQKHSRQPKRPARADVMVGCVDSSENQVRRIRTGSPHCVARLEKNWLVLEPSRSECWHTSIPIQRFAAWNQPNSTRVLDRFSALTGTGSRHVRTRLPPSRRNRLDSTEVGSVMGATAPVWPRRLDRSSRCDRKLPVGIASTRQFRSDTNSLPPENSTRPPPRVGDVTGEVLHDDSARSFFTICIGMRFALVANVSLLAAQTLATSHDAETSASQR